MKNLILLSIIIGLVFAKESILSINKELLFKYDKQKAIEDSEKLRLDWINPITLKYLRDDDKNYFTKKSMVSINQPIFKSGGIYSAIKYANAMQKYSTLNVEAKRKALIKDATTLLFNIKKQQFELKKQEKLLENNQIRYNIKKERVSLGLSSASELYELDIELDKNRKLIADLKLQRNDLISKFKTLSDKNYQTLPLPKLKLITKREYEKRNINLKIYKSEIDTKDYLYSMTISNYLPTLSLYYNYTKIHETDNPILKEGNSYSYGFSISLPLDIKSIDLIQSNRVAYLKSKLNYIDKQNEEKLFFENKINKIASIKEKESITLNSIKNYNKLIKEYSIEYQNRLKTKDDVTLYKNLKIISEYNLKIYDIEKQIELLELYAKTED